MDTIGIGLLGSGFMGKCHALAYRMVQAVFGDVPTPRLEMLADAAAPDQIERTAAQFGFARATQDWRALVADPAVDIVCVATPNRLHAAMARAALAAGKHVHCEKPMAITLDDARAMTEAARTCTRMTLVGYNYLHNPAFTHARALVRGGAIGRIIHFRGVFDEDYQADPALPWSWRATRSDAGFGALGDMGCHLLSMAMDLVGPVESLVAEMQTVHATRPTEDGRDRRRVENEDVASALIRFRCGVQGVISTSRAAWGRKNHLAFEIHGDEGMIAFDQERLNELRIYRNAGELAGQGFTTIRTGAAHPPYGDFCPAPGHQLGFNELKVVEARAFLKAIAENRSAYPSFADALEIEKVLHAIATASAEDRRVHLDAF